MQLFLASIFVLLGAASVVAQPLEAGGGNGNPNGGQIALRLLNAALVRMQADGTYQAIVDQFYAEQAAGDPFLADDAPNYSVLNFYTEADDSVDFLTFPPLYRLPGRIRNIVRGMAPLEVCDFLLPIPTLLLHQRLFPAVIETIENFYGTTIQVEFVLSAISLGSNGWADNLSQGNCDVSIAPGAIGGFYENPALSILAPRVNGDEPAFLVSLPTQASSFSVLVKDDSAFTTFSDVVAAAAVGLIEVCRASRNDGISRTYFRNAAAFDDTTVPFNIKSTCEGNVLNQNLTPGSTAQEVVFFSEFEAVGTTVTPGLRAIFSGATAAIGYYVRNPSFNP